MMNDGTYSTMYDLLFSITKVQSKQLADYLLEQLSSCKYLGTMSHDLVLKQMSDNDVLIFPSLFEGFGLVITESMSQGTPVITTDRTCGPDIMTNGKDGWIVEAGTSEPIRALLKSFIDSPEILQKREFNKQVQNYEMFL